MEFLVGQKSIANIFFAYLTKNKFHGIQIISANISSLEVSTRKKDTSKSSCPKTLK
jgi:hypothetical protein